MKHIHRAKGKGGLVDRDYPPKNDNHFFGRRHIGDNNNLFFVLKFNFEL